jgi:hypothetical protein
MSLTPGEQKAKSLMEAMSELDTIQARAFTATLIGVLQAKFSPEEFVAAIAEAKVLALTRRQYRKAGGDE